MFVDVNKVSQALNVTAQRVQQLANEGMPKEGRGKYDLGKCMVWYIRYLQKALERRAVPTSDGEYTALGDVKVRSIRADAELKELELARQRRELIAATDVEQRWSEIVAVTKARFLALAPRLNGGAVAHRAAAGAVRSWNLSSRWAGWRSLRSSLASGSESRRQ